MNSRWQKQVRLVSGVNIGIHIPQQATVTKGYLNYPVYNLHQNVTGHVAFSHMRDDMYILLSGKASEI